MSTKVQEAIKKLQKAWEAAQQAGKEAKKD